MHKKYKNNCLDEKQPKAIKKLISILKKTGEAERWPQNLGQWVKVG